MTFDGPIYSHTARRWKWRVTLTYNATVEPPKRPGDIAIQTVHADDLSKDMEVDAANRRTDVDVAVLRLPARLP